jgi:hypothetical protein
MILPVPGRWQAAGLTEGGFTWRITPSTILRMVPLPVPGRIGVAFDFAQAERGAGMSHISPPPAILKTP